MTLLVLFPCIPVSRPPRVCGRSASITYMSLTLTSPILGLLDTRLQHSTHCSLVTYRAKAIVYDKTLCLAINNTLARYNSRLPSEHNTLPSRDRHRTKNIQRANDAKVDATESDHPPCFKQPSSHNNNNGDLYSALTQRTSHALCTNKIIN